MFYYVKKYIPIETKKVFKSIRDVPSAFNNVSTATDYNFKATELKVIPQYCIAHPRCTARSFALVHVHKNYRNCPQAKLDLTNKEASTVLCSVVKHAGSGRA